MFDAINIANPIDIVYVETTIRYKFKDVNYLIEALTAAGPDAASEDIVKFLDGNRRLALLGDSIIKLVLLNTWFTTGRSRCKASSKHIIFT